MPEPCQAGSEHVAVDNFRAGQRICATIRCMAPQRMKPRPALTVGRVYRRSDLLGLGFRERDLTTCRFVTRLFRDAYVATGSQIDLALRARAALTVLPEGSLIDGPTAARLWGGVVPGHEAITASVAAPHQVRADGISATIRDELAARARRRRYGVAVCDPATAFTDCAHRLGLVDLVVLADGLIAAGVVAPADLVAAAVGLRSRGRRHALEAARLARSGVDSPPETRLRLLLVFAGLPEPQTNIIIRRADGSWDRRHDMGWEEVKVAGEYDGRHHAESTVQWRRDLRRREESDRDGWRHVVVTSEDLYVEPGETLRRFRDVLRERGMSCEIRSDRWRRFFPGRR